MITRLYSMYDRRMREYGQIATAKNDESITRGISDSIRGSNSVVEKHPGDFDVYIVGEFNDETGEVVRLVPRLVCNVGEYLREVDAPPVEGMRVIPKEA